MNTRRAYVFNNRRPQKIPKKFFGPPKINLIFNFSCQRWEKLKTTVHKEGLLKKKGDFFAFFPPEALLAALAGAPRDILATYGWPISKQTVGLPVIKSWALQSQEFGSYGP